MVWKRKKFGVQVGRGAAGAVAGVIGRKPVCADGLGESAGKLGFGDGARLPWVTTTHGAWVGPLAAAAEPVALSPSEPVSASSTPHPDSSAGASNSTAQFLRR